MWLLNTRAVGHRRLHEGLLRGDVGLPGVVLIALIERHVVPTLVVIDRSAPAPLPLEQQPLLRRELHAILVRVRARVRVRVRARVRFRVRLGFGFGLGLGFGFGLGAGSAGASILQLPPQPLPLLRGGDLVLGLAQLVLKARVQRRLLRHARHDALRRQLAQGLLRHLRFSQ